MEISYQISDDQPAVMVLTASSDSDEKLIRRLATKKPKSITKSSLTSTGDKIEISFPPEPKV